MAIGLRDFHVVDSRPVHDGFRGLATGDAAARRDLGILAVGARDLVLRVEREEQDEDEKDPE